MPSSPLGVVVRQLCSAAERDGFRSTDGELLTLFLSRRDEDALAALVERHAAMVWGVCNRVLGNRHDAEDAFQATFLVLVQKAATVKPREMVSNWLHGVAQQTAVRLRATVAKRRWREAQMNEMLEPAVAEAHDEELRSVLDQELCRLPERFRALIVRCDLEGHTRKDVARQLGCPEGTVASGLARARALLAKRLLRRGLAVSGGSLTAVWSAGSASASAPPALVASTIRAASVLAAGKATANGAISVKVAALTDGVVKAMFMTKLKSVIALVMVFGVMGAGGTSLAYRVAAGQDGSKPTTDVPTSRTTVAQDGKEPGADKPREGDKPSPKDLRKIEPPGGVPLSLVEPGTKKIGFDQLNKVRERLRSVPEKDLEQWIVALERIMDVKLKDGLPSPRQACRTDFVVRMSMAFDDLKWNATVADKLFKRACTMPTAEAKAWKEAFESLLKEKIGIEETGKDEFSNLAGGPPWAVPLVLIPVDALHEGQKYSVERGKKYLARLKQLTKDDVALWRDKVDKFGGTELDAAVNIILLDEFFSKEAYQRDRFKAAVERLADNKPVAWGKEVNGVQIGIRLGEERTYQVGENVTLVLRIRNNSPESVPFRQNAEYFLKNPPLITEADGKAVTIKAMSVWGFIRQSTVEPGKEVELMKLTLALRPATEREKEAAWTLYGTGKFQIQYPIEDVVGEVRLGSPGMTLTTGKLDLDVNEAVPEMPKAQMPTDAIRAARDVKLTKEFNANKLPVEFKVESVTKAIPIKAASTDTGTEWVKGHGPGDLCVRAQSPADRTQDRFVVMLTAETIKQLNKTGVTDIEKHFQARTVRVTGAISRRDYRGYGTPAEVEIVVDDLSHLEVLD